MKNYARIWFFFLIIYSVACAPREQQTSIDADIQAINKLTEREGTAFSSGNIEDMLTLFTNDCVVMPPNAPKVNGHAAMQSWLEGLHENVAITGGYTDLHVDVVGDWAIQRYTANLTITPKAGGESVEESLKGIHIFRRQPDGTWLIEQDIWNTDTPSE